MLTQEELLELDIKLRAYLGKILEDHFDADEIDEITYTVSEIVLDAIEGGTGDDE